MSRLPNLPQFLGICTCTELQIFFASLQEPRAQVCTPRFGFGALLKTAVTFHAFLVADFCLGSSYKAVLAQGKEAPSWYRSLDVRRNLCKRLDPQSFEQGMSPGDLLVHVSDSQHCCYCEET